MSAPDQLTVQCILKMADLFNECPWDVIDYFNLHVAMEELGFVVTDGQKLINLVERLRKGGFVFCPRPSYLLATPEEEAA